jgi:LysM repeat protein
VCAEIAEEAVECKPGDVIDYVVKPGDTFFKLAQKYSTTVQAIQQANPGVNPENLRVGQVIIIPCGAKG